MIVLKVLFYSNNEGLEATWLERNQAPDIITPAIATIPATYDEEGVELTPAVEAVPESITSGEITENQLWCQSYHPTQMQMLRDKAAEFGTDLVEHEASIYALEASYVPPIPKPLTLADFQAAHDAHLNSKARERNYDSIHTASLRAAYPGPWHDEGVAYATWMDDCNAAGYAILAAVNAGTSPAPATVEDYVAMLPELVLP